MNFLINFFTFAVLKQMDERGKGVLRKEREEGRGKWGRMKKETEARGGKRERKKEKSCCWAGTQTQNLGFQDIVHLDLWVVPLFVCLVLYAIGRCAM